MLVLSLILSKILFENMLSIYCISLDIKTISIQIYPTCIILFTHFYNTFPQEKKETEGEEGGDVGWEIVKGLMCAPQKFRGSHNVF